MSDFEDEVLELGQVAGDQAAVDQSAGDQAAVDQSAGDQAAVDQSAVDQSAGDQADGDQADGDQVAVDQAAGDQAAGDQADGDQVAGGQDTSETDLKPDFPSFTVEGDFIWGGQQDSFNEPPEPAQEVPAELVGIETYSLSPVTPADAQGLKKVLLEVIGNYDNVVTQYKYLQGSNSYYTYVNEITPDYPWIASALLFIAMVVSLFQIVRRAFWRQ